MQGTIRHFSEKRDKNLRRLSGIGRAIVPGKGQIPEGGVGTRPEPKAVALSVRPEPRCPAPGNPMFAPRRSVSLGRPAVAFAGVWSMEPGPCGAASKQFPARVGCGSTGSRGRGISAGSRSARPTPTTMKKSSRRPLGEVPDAESLRKCGNRLPASLPPEAPGSRHWVVVGGVEVSAFRACARVPHSCPVALARAGTCQQGPHA